MDKNTAKVSIKNVYSEAFGLQVSALIQLFEIDVGQISFGRGFSSQSENDVGKNIFRFHNNVKLGNTSIYWKGKEYVAAPIQIEGFEIKSAGVLPTPKLSIIVDDSGIPTLSLLKDKINQLGDIVGAKVTRIRTFAKFLDAENFFGQIPPNGFAPDPNAELPRDIYYIDRKSLENKNILEFELSSFWDVEGVRLPGRLVVSNSCPFAYRGAGCHYEYKSRRNINEHGADAILPDTAIPIATEYDENIIQLLGGNIPVDRGEYNSSMIYNSGEATYIEHNNRKFYFVGNTNNIPVGPPDVRYWIRDECGRKLISCEARWGVFGPAEGSGITKGFLPYGGWTAINRFK